jgi:hypothetical protein
VRSRCFFPGIRDWQPSGGVTDFDVLPFRPLPAISSRGWAANIDVLEANHIGFDTLRKNTGKFIGYCRVPTQRQARSGLEDGTDHTTWGPGRRAWQSTDPLES